MVVKRERFVPWEFLFFGERKTDTRKQSNKVISHSDDCCELPNRIPAERVLLYQEWLGKASGRMLHLSQIADDMKETWMQNLGVFKTQSSWVCASWRALSCSEKWRKLEETVSHWDQAKVSDWFTHKVWFALNCNVAVYCVGPHLRCFVCGQ